MKIKEWVNSFSGCDGGNPNADIWLCGIEWGGASKVENYYSKTLPDEVGRGAVKEVPSKYDWKDSITYSYGRGFAKLYMAMHGKPVEKYSEIEGLNGDKVFKMNLYPIAFDSTSPELWQANGLKEITGFEDKYLFNTWCFFHRFPHFSNLRKKHKPKVIICTGVNYLIDFLSFFAGNEEIGTIQKGKLIPQSEPNKKDRTYYWLKIDQDTTLFVLPFFSGAYGLNSNYLLHEMGKQIAAIQSKG